MIVYNIVNRNIRIFRQSFDLYRKYTVRNISICRYVFPFVCCILFGSFKAYPIAWSYFSIIRTNGFRV